MHIYAVTVYVYGVIPMEHVELSLEKEGFAITKTEVISQNTEHLLTDLVFAVYQTKRMPNPDGIYDDIAKAFAKTLDRMGKGEREDSNQNGRQITLHSFHSQHNVGSG